ncbi:hypothetical protein GLAREA_07978 [Glarea lozoyensis ATCC 20868]|uniref:Uncharacterized protein n=1 Tax=Glarea lozoyensis (strain ATCC 20868 / MF5171) TaxID=1116229 RepID=S3DBU2_GLAL2|nr:uncharacterized protein GLAREA_07978 [Glarea lozoyensis ATCC 20868]EPE24128.1 hypothetical protein GLAREA_07978 [Glarea lozoyensis ATCC 20868]
MSSSLSFEGGLRLTSTIISDFFRLGTGNYYKQTPNRAKYSSPAHRRAHHRSSRNMRLAPQPPSLDSQTSQQVGHETLGPDATGRVEHLMAFKSYSPWPGTNPDTKRKFAVDHTSPDKDLEQTVEAVPSILSVTRQNVHSNAICSTFENVEDNEEQSVSSTLSSSRQRQPSRTTTSEMDQSPLPDVMSPLHSSIPENPTPPAKTVLPRRTLQATALGIFSNGNSFFQRLMKGFGNIVPNSTTNRNSAILVPFQAENVKMIKKNLYDAYKVPVPAALKDQWHHVIHKKLQNNIEAVIQKIGLQPNEMAVYVGLSMVGPKVENMLRLLPTIVILCAHKEAKVKFKQLIESKKLDYLHKLACPYLVCVWRRECTNVDRFFADIHSPSMADLDVTSTQHAFAFPKQENLMVKFELAQYRDRHCGLKIEFTNSSQQSQPTDNLPDHSLDCEQHMTARVGGLVVAGGQNLCHDYCAYFSFRPSS